MKKTIYIFGILLAWIPLMHSSIIFAQDTIKDIVIIHGNFTPIVKDAYKLSERPEIIISDEKKIDVKYTALSTIYDIPYQLEKIEAAKMKGEPLSKLYKSTFKVGYGTYQTPLAEYYFNNTRSKKLAYGFSFKHLSSNGKIKNYGFPGYTDNTLNLYGKKFFPQHTLESNINWNYNTLHQYGYESSLYPLLNKNNTRQRYMTSGIKNKFFSNYTSKNKIHHQSELNYYNLFDINNTQENNVFICSDLNKNIDIDKEINDEKINIHIEGLFNSIKSKNSLLQNGIIKISPSLYFKAKDLTIIAGFNSVVEIDSTTYLRFFPIIDAKLSIVKDILIAYGGINGNVHKNSFKSLIDENPFILSELNYLNTREKMHAYFGFKGNISSKSTFSIGISNHNLINTPLFVTDFSQTIPNKFTVIYDTIKDFRINGELTYKKGTKLNLGVNAQYHFYQTTKEIKAWHKPNIEINGFAHYNIKDKIIAKANILYWGKTYSKNIIKTARNTDSTTYITNKNFIDISIGIEYRYTKLLSAFIDFNNIGAVRYYPWYNYPSQRFCLIGGITYTF